MTSPSFNSFMVLDIDDKLLANQILQLQHRLSSDGLEEFLEDVAHPYLQDRASARFAAEGDDAVGQWLPLDATTVQIRLALGYGGAHPINVRTRDLLTYIITAAPQTGRVAEGMELTFPSSGGDPLIQEKIRTAQMGKSVPSTPPRPVVALSEKDSSDLTMLLSDYITEGLVGGVI